MEKLALLLLLKKRKAMRNRQFNQTFVIDHLYYLSFFSFSDYQFKCLFRMTQMQFQSLYQILLQFNHQKPVSLYADIMNNEFNLNHDGQMFKLLTDSAFRRQPFIIKTNATDFHRRRMFLSEHRDLSNESARTCIECIFGVMVNRWQIFGKRIIDTTDRIKWLVVSGCCIHNYLQ